MVKGFSESEAKNSEPIKDFKEKKKGLASFLKGKKFILEYYIFVI